MVDLLIRDSDKKNHKWFRVKEDETKGKGKGKGDQSGDARKHSTLYHVMQRRKESYYKGIQVEQHKKKLLIKKASGVSCYCLKADSKFRIFLFDLVQSDDFDVAIIIVILISTVSLCSQNNRYDPKGPVQSFFSELDIITTYIFTAEALLKIGAYGFYFNGPFSYLKNFEGVFDFVIVVSALLSQSEMEEFKSFSKLKMLRILRVIRPLRIISRSE